MRDFVMSSGDMRRELKPRLRIRLIHKVRLGAAMSSTVLAQALARLETGLVGIADIGGIHRQRVELARRERVSESRR